GPEERPEAVHARQVRGVPQIRDERRGGPADARRRVGRAADPGAAGHADAPPRRGALLDPLPEALRLTPKKGVRHLFSKNRCQTPFLKNGCQTPCSEKMEKMVSDTFLREIGVRHLFGGWVSGTGFAA